MLGFAYKERRKVKCEGEGKYKIDYATTYFNS